MNRNEERFGFVFFPKDRIETTLQRLARHIEVKDPVILQSIADSPWLIGSLVDCKAIFLFFDEMETPKTEIQSLCEDPSLANTPKIFVLSETDSSLKLQALKLGCSDFIEFDAPAELLIARLNAQLRRKKLVDKLQAIAVDRDMFAAGVLHDIKGLESSIYAVVGACKKRLEKQGLAARDEIREKLSLLQDRAASLNSYAVDVIQSVRASQKSVELGPTRLGPILEWCEIIINQGNELESIGKKITIQTPENLQPVLADPHFLKLVALNILQNASKYVDGPEVKVMIEQKISPDRQSGNNRPMIQTSFRDFGSGVPPEMLSKIFRPFVRHEQNTSQKGSGLGLAMVVKAAQAMGGQVWAELPQQGTGLKVSVELPAV